MYSQSITRTHRTAFVVLVDGSGSMGEEILFRGIRISKAKAVSMIANELLFELIERARRTEGIRDYYDVALYVANWPDKRRMAWDVLLRARAIENQAVVIGVNRVGNDPMCCYDGGTAAIDFFGFVAAHCDDNAEQAVIYEVKMEELHQYRNKFPSLNDSDDFRLTKR